jgi:hypothetical protein
MLKRPAVGGAIVALVLAALPLQANAGISAWGCASEFKGGTQIIFNQAVLLMLDQPSQLDLMAIILDSDGLEKHPSRSRFKARVFSTSFEPKKLRFGANEADAPLLLTERSSKRVSYRNGRAGPRDEITTRWRKIYRIEGNGEKPRDVAMNCMEYILSTMGGRLR